MHVLVLFTRGYTGAVRVSFMYVHVHLCVSMYVSKRESALLRTNKSHALILCTLAVI